MNHGHHFDIALSEEHKAEQKRKQEERKARERLEKAAPALLAACENALKKSHNPEVEKILVAAIALAKPEQT